MSAGQQQPPREEYSPSRAQNVQAHAGKGLHDQRQASGLYLTILTCIVWMWSTKRTAKAEAGRLAAICMQGFARLWQLLPIATVVLCRWQRAPPGAGACVCAVEVPAQTLMQLLQLLLLLHGGAGCADAWHPRNLGGPC